VILRRLARTLPGAGLLLAALLGHPAPGGAQAPDPYAVLDAAAERFGRIQTLCADFRQVLDVRLLGETHEGTGRLCQRRPDLFSMRFDDPAGDLVVVDGESVWMYTPSRDPEQVLRTSISAGTRGLNLHGEFLDSPRTRYDAASEGTDTVEGLPSQRILLRPREPAGYREAVVWIGPDRLLRQVEIREENGSVRTVTLLTSEAEVDVPEGTFSFTPPPGVRVVTR
jgi:chaperone LolA